MLINCRVCGRAHSVAVDVRYRTANLSTHELRQVVAGLGCPTCEGYPDHMSDTGERKLLDARWLKSVTEAYGPQAARGFGATADPVVFFTYEPAAPLVLS